jgi:hypothetical protein
MTFGGYVCIHFFELEGMPYKFIGIWSPQTKKHNMFQPTSRRDLPCEFKALFKGSKMAQSLGKILASTHTYC